MTLLGPLHTLGSSFTTRARPILLLANALLLLVCVWFLQQQRQQQQQQEGKLLQLPQQQRQPVTIVLQLLLVAGLWTLAVPWSALAVHMNRQKAYNQQASCTLGKVHHLAPPFLSASSPSKDGADLKDAPDLLRGYSKQGKDQVQEAQMPSKPNSKLQTWQQSSTQPCSSSSSYQSSLQRLQVNFKVLTEHGPEDLPDHMAQQLHCRLSCIGHQLLGLAARKGCVCICVDMAVPHGMLRAGPQGEPCYSAADLACMVLPLLQPMLQQHLVNNPNRPTVLVQLGQTMLTASYDSASQTWKLEPQVSETLPQGTPSMMLGVAKQMPARSNLLTQQLHAKHTAVSSNSNTGALAAAEGTQGTQGLFWGSGVTAAAESPAPVPEHSMHSMQLVVQMLPGEGATGLTTCQLASVMSWEAPRGDTHETVGGSALRLLARCSGTYVTTCVLEVSDPAPGCAVAAVKLELHVPDSLLPRHHVGGPPVGLLPVTLELWQGALSCVSSTPLLLQLHTASSSDTVSSSSWWWGASRLTVQRAVQDLEQTNTSLSASMHSARSVQRMMDVFKMWHAFYEDLLVWLRQLQYAAVLSDQCTSHPPVSGLACTVVQQPTLPPDQLAAMGLQLLRFAENLELSGVQQMLQQQYSVVQAWAQSACDHTCVFPATSINTLATSTGATGLARCNDGAHAITPTAGQRRTEYMDHVPLPKKPWGFKTLLLRSVQAVLAGAPCPQCEARYRDDMAHTLAGAQAVPSCLFALGYLWTCTQTMKRGSPATWIMTIPWALLHLMIVLQQLGLMCRGKTPASILSCRSGITRLTCAAYWSRVGAQAVFGWSSIALSASLQQELRSGMYLLWVVCMAVGEQVSSLMLLPPLLALAATLFESLHVMAMMQRVGGLTLFTALVTLTAVMLPRLMVETYLRMASMKRARAHVAHSSHAVAATAAVDAATINGQVKNKAD